jgi:hypothetical protein
MRLLQNERKNHNKTVSSKETENLLCLKSINLFERKGNGISFSFFFILLEKEEEKLIWEIRNSFNVQLF